MTVKELIACLLELPQEAQELPVVYEHDGATHHVESVAVFGGQEVELS